MKILGKYQQILNILYHMISAWLCDLQRCVLLYVHKSGEKTWFTEISASFLRFFSFKKRIYVYRHILTKIEVLVKNWSFGQKSKFWSKIEILVKNRNFGQKSKFCSDEIELHFYEFAFEKIRFMFNDQIVLTWMF